MNDFDEEDIIEAAKDIMWKGCGLLVILGLVVLFVGLICYK